MTSWFRSWHGAPTDNKWLVIAAKAKVKPGIVSAVAWALFDHASQADERGSVAGFDVETFSVFSGFEESEVQAVIEAMCIKGVIDHDNRLASWNKRQPKREDDSTERVRALRLRNNGNDSNDNGADVTQCNAEKRTVTHGNNTEQNRTDTEAETEQNRTEEAAAARAPARTYESETAAVFSCWSDNMPGTMSTILADDLGDLVNTYGPDTVIRAITEAVRSNGRSIRYVSTILESWATGKQKPAGKNGRGTSKVDKSMANAAALMDKLEELEKRRAL